MEKTNSGILVSYGDKELDGIFFMVSKAEAVNMMGRGRIEIWGYVAPADDGQVLGMASNS